MSSILESINSTVTPAASYIGTYAKLSDAHADTLNIVERVWASYFVWWGNDLIACGIFIFLLHEILYFGRCVPWMILDQIPYFHKWKIQGEAKVPSVAEQWECMKSVLISHFMVEAIPIWGFYPVCKYAGISIDVPFPSWMKICAHLALFFVLEDTWHYWLHRGLHYGPFYKYIHKQHHRYAAPFGLTAEYAHPVEVALLGVGTVGIPIAWVMLTGDLHLFTVSVWIALRLFQAIDAHSGYEFPVSLHHFLPIWAGADHHDDHHRYFTGNYASSFRWWDFVLDTEAGPAAKAERTQRLAAKAAKAAKKQQ